jgi:hypothetical protein
LAERGEIGKSCPLLQSEHEQHRLAAHFAKLRGVDECGLQFRLSPVNIATYCLPPRAAKPRNVKDYSDGANLQPSDYEAVL